MNTSVGRELSPIWAYQTQRWGGHDVTPSFRDEGSVWVGAAQEVSWRRKLLPAPCELGG